MFDQTGFGLEVGPSYNPLLPKSEGFKVETIDHADAATLRKKYISNAENIEEVDYVSDGRSMLEIIGEQARYDFIVASHVIEHVTDIVRFLQDCEALLKPNGRLVLAVPDKRYCFDALRPLSTVGQALQAYAEKRQRHTAGSLFDHVGYFCKTPRGTVWKEQVLDDIIVPFTAGEANDKFNTVLASDQYHDVHAWQFTPASFRFLVKTLRDTGYIQSGEASFYKHPCPQPGMHEFYISLSKAAGPIEESGTSLLRQAEAELREVSFDAPRPDPEKVELRAQLEAARRQAKYLESVNQQLRASTSWRVTAPLRYLKTMFS
nr:methyltransferase domain-containing protein [Mesorhizobium sp. M2A.F.Ca.ET.067.02.1.1]